MAKLGYLYLHKGKWNKQEIVPASWVQLTTSPQADINKDRMLGGLFPPQLLATLDTSIFPFSGYGYLWWVNTIPERACYHASGFGGQHLFIFPDLDMIVIETASDEFAPEDNPFDRIFGLSGIQLIGNHILPAVVKL